MFFRHRHPQASNFDSIKKELDLGGFRQPAAPSGDGLRLEDKMADCPTCIGSLSFATA